jgi:hypothetical protein
MVSYFLRWFQELEEGEGGRGRGGKEVGIVFAVCKVCIENKNGEAKN